MEKFTFDKDVFSSKKDELNSKLKEHAPDMEAIKKVLNVFSAVQNGDLSGAMDQYQQNQDMFSSLAEKAKLNKTSSKRLTLKEADDLYMFTDGEVLDYFNNLDEDMKKFISSSINKT